MFKPRPTARTLKKMAYAIDFAYDGVPPLRLTLKASGDTFFAYAVNCLVLLLLILCDVALSVSRVVFVVLAFANYSRMNTEQEATWLLVYASLGLVWGILFILRCYYARSERKGVLRVLAGWIALALFVCTCYGISVFSGDDLPRSIAVVSFAFQMSLISWVSMYCVFIVYISQK
jgi:hypothetical protein